MKIHIFKPSGKWYTDIEIDKEKYQKILKKHDFIYDVYSEVISKYSNYKPIKPIDRTIDSWFALVEEPYHTIIWLNQ